MACLTPSHSTTKSAVSGHVCSLFLCEIVTSAVAIHENKHPTDKEGIKQQKPLHLKICLLLFLMSAFTLCSQPAQVGRLALWVGSLTGTVAVFLSLAVTVANITAARAP